MRNEKPSADPLAVAFRREAEKDSPHFSPLLHERIMRSVSSARAPAKRGARASWLWQGPAAIAAAIALMFVLRIWSGSAAHFPSSKPEHPTVEANVLPPIPEVGAAVAEISDPAARQFEAARYAYLDEDAQRLTHYMIDQIDVLPAQR